MENFLTKWGYNGKYLSLHLEGILFSSGGRDGGGVGKFPYWRKS